MQSMGSVLCCTGVLLFLIGLLTGFAIPACRSPRIGLSAHLTGVQSGTFLIVMGLLWPALRLPAMWSGSLGHALWLALYALFASLLLGGIFGAGRGLPIAGGGITTTPARQLIVSVLLIGGSLVSLVAVAGVLLEGQWRAIG